MEVERLEMIIADFESKELNKELEKGAETSILKRLDQISFTSVAHARKMMEQLNTVISSKNETILRLEKEIKSEDQVIHITQDKLNLALIESKEVKKQRDFY